ncbi:MAG: hypothetical protein QOD56_3088 [Gammaproteobacteria bacterium]|nr:hypothetical protein [Gammaproteobacteria bacterium]
MFEGAVPSRIPNPFGVQRSSFALLAFAVISGCSYFARESQLATAPVGLQIRCATASVVGLAWLPPDEHAKVSSYHVYRDGVEIGTSFTPEFDDTSVVDTTAYSYSIVALSRRRRASPAASITATTAAASGNGDAPYCRRRVIDSISWHWSDAYTQPNGSDLWPVTWGEDGNVYALFGDGGGFGGSDTRGRTSFGAAMMSGPPPPGPEQQVNLYGGFRSLHPSTISGKGGSVIAVGKDFYAIAGIYRPSDTQRDYPSQPSGSPHHVGLVYSTGNAFSWRDSGWSFCSASASGRERLAGRFCATGFVNHGKGNAGAPGEYVYLLGVANSPLQWIGSVAPVPSDTFLARVSKRRMLKPSSYRYFAGLDPQGRPIWSADVGRMLPIFRDRNPPRSGCSGSCNMTSTLADVVYDAQLNRYVGVAQGDYLSQSSFYDAPAMWGPWTSISYFNIDPATGTGGWGNLGTAAGDAMGVHPVNAWTGNEGRTMWMIFSSNGRAPDGASFPPAGTAMDSFNLVEATFNVVGRRLANEIEKRGP